MDKAPRHYAEQILELQTREERNRALQQVPEHLQGIVRRHVENAFIKKKLSRSIEI